MFLLSTHRGPSGRASSHCRFFLKCSLHPHHTTELRDQCLKFLPQPRRSVRSSTRLTEHFTSPSYDAGAWGRDPHAEQVISLNSRRKCATALKREPLLGVNPRGCRGTEDRRAPHLGYVFGGRSQENSPLGSSACGFQRDLRNKAKRQSIAKRFRGRSDLSTEVPLG